MRKLVRLSLVAGASVAVVGGALAAVPSSAAAGGGICQLNGAANFHGPGGVGAGGPGSDPTAAWTYDFFGQLTGCHSDSDPANGGGGGNITAGQLFTDATGTTHQEPLATGSGSCAAGTTDGTAFVQWANGGLTIITYKTVAAAAGVALEGQVVPSFTFADGFVATSDTYTGTQAGSIGALTFQVADPTVCATSHVDTAAISGVTGIGTSGT